MGRRELQCEVQEWISLIQERVQWRLPLTVMIGLHNTADPRLTGAWINRCLYGLNKN